MGRGGEGGAPARARATISVICEPSSSISAHDATWSATSTSTSTSTAAAAAAAAATATARCHDACAVRHRAHAWRDLSRRHAPAASASCCC